ncbi:hypothetical protein Salmi_Mp101 (mitochondrion) [Salvia miltiorrhiza]|uniref:Uncharacterized protein n=1 Tax=Salvia miltiorrhiza TaxID=226208 RepID=V9P591_SALMI|nr:hypothetical protein Salmi_Mp101 [Salvia miltiorrhiza]AGU16629.1 hypothetical protein Salmi_Mp101 [Salvia miltiorrhiza]
MQSCSYRQRGYSRPAMQFVLHGDIILPPYKWRFFTSFLHPTLILYLILPTLVMDMNPVFNRLSAIPAEIAQVQYDLERSYRGLNRRYTRRRVDEDEDRRQRIISAARERIVNLEGRQQALRAEQQELIVLAVTHATLGD